MAPRKRRAPATATAAAAAADRSIIVALPAGTEQPLASQKEPRTGLARPSAAARSHCVDRAVVNNAELRANSQNILSMIRSARPKNTASAYEPKQEEFRRFC